MKLSYFLFSLILSSVNAQLWPNFHTTYSNIPFVGGLHSQPQVQNLAEALGWTLFSPCGDNSSSWIGNRFGHGITRDDFSIIFDVNGFISGMQSIVPKFKADEVDYDFDADPWYILGDFFGLEVYFATVYFVDPEIICTTGRTREEYDLQGTGYTLKFQTGPNPLEDLKEVPLSEAAANAGGEWFSHKCHDNMGSNFFSHPAGDTGVDCNTLLPIKLMYDANGQLNAFSWQHQVGLTNGLNWEDPSESLLNDVYDPSAPQCILDKVASDDFATMHVFVAEMTPKC